MFDFPTAPTDGQVVTFPEGPAYKWNAASTAWDRNATTTPPPVPRPVVTSIDPFYRGNQDADFTMRVLGSNFTADSKACINFVEQTTTFVSDTEITCNVSPVALGYSNNTITVRTQGLSSTLPGVALSIILHPEIQALIPTTAPIAGGAFALTVDGDNFADVQYWPDWPTELYFDGVLTPYTSPASNTLQATITPTGVPRTVQVQINSGTVAAVSPPFDFVLT